MFAKIKIFANKYQAIIVGFAFALMFYGLGIVVCVLSGEHARFSEHIFSTEPTHLYHRIVVTGMFIAFGIFAHIIMARRKATEDKMAESRRQYRVLFKNMLNGMAYYQLITDELDNPVDFVLLEANPAYYKTTGLNPADLIGQKASQTTPWILKEAIDWLDIYGRAALKGDETKIETFLKHLGKWLFISVYSPERGYFVTIIEDISERKKIEILISENKERMDAIFNSIQVGIVVVDKETHTITYVNPAATRMISAPRDEIMDHPCQKFICPADIGACPITDKRQKVDNSERILLTADGRQIPILKTVVETELEGRPVLVESFVDITERKRAEVALNAEAIRRRILIDQSRDGIVVLAQDGSIYESNQRFAEMLGFSPEETKQLHVWDWEFQYTREQTMDMIRNVNEAGNFFETRHRRKDGTIVDVEISTNGAAFEGEKLIFCVCRDITERKKAWQEIEDIRRRMEMILSSAGEGIYGLDDKRRTIFINPAAAEMLGYSSEELIGKSQHALTHHTKPDGSPYPAHECPIHASIKDGQIHHVTGEVFWRKDGSSFPVEYTSTPTIENGRTNGSVVVFRDITERKQSEALQSAIYKISEISTSAENLLELYAGIHMVVDEMMSTTNFYIALYNEKEDRLEFPYFVDERDPSPVSRPLKKGLTEYVLRNKKPLLAPPMVQRKMADAGEIEMVGTPSVDWMGVPLNIGKTIFGVLVVQSYREEVRFGALEISTLNFISDNIAAAILRKKAEDERKRLVKELQESLNNIKTLKGLVPICSSCKKIRNDKGYWQQVEVYVSEHTEADFSHGICDECAHKLYPQYFKDKKNKTQGEEVG